VKENSSPSENTTKKIRKKYSTLNANITRKIGKKYSGPKNHETSPSLPLDDILPGNLRKNSLNFLKELRSCTIFELGPMIGTEFPGNRWNWLVVCASSILPRSFTKKGVTIYNKYKNLGEALKLAYPQFDWNIEIFSAKGKRSVQGWYVLKGRSNTRVAHHCHQKYAVECRLPEDWR
jgi:hypothetical protein